MATTRNLKNTTASAAIYEEVKEKTEKRGRKPYVDPSEKKSAQATIKLRPDTKKNLQDLAYLKRVSLSELIEQIGQEYYEKNYKKIKEAHLKNFENE